MIYSFGDCVVTKESVKERQSAIIVNVPHLYIAVAECSTRVRACRRLFDEEVVDRFYLMALAILRVDIPCALHRLVVGELVLVDLAGRLVGLGIPPRAIIEQVRVAPPFGQEQTDVIVIYLPDHQPWRGGADRAAEDVVVGPPLEERP